MDNNKSLSMHIDISIGKEKYYRKQEASVVITLIITGTDRQTYPGKYGKQVLEAISLNK